MPRRSRPIRLPHALVLGLPAALMVLAACSSPAPDDLPVQQLSPPTTPRGWMLSSGHVFGQGLLATRLPDGRPRQLQLPIDAIVVDARWADPGQAAYAFVQPGTDQGEVQLERIGLDGPAQPIGDVLRGVSSTSAAAGAYLVATCRHGDGSVQVVAPGDTAWRRVADGCVATLSPDGRTVAFSDDGHTVRTVPAAGGQPATLFDADGVDGLRSAGLRDPRIRAMAWGSAGLGLIVHRGQVFGIVVHTDHGDHVGAIPGAPAFVGGLRWQPDGPLLAVATFFQGQGSILRAVDARTGSVSVLATDPRFLGGTVWSPDGSLLASLDSRGAWVFLDGNGNRASVVPVDNELPFDWAS